MTSSAVAATSSSSEGQVLGVADITTLGSPQLPTGSREALIKGRR
jgi:hypothetical protein